MPKKYIRKARSTLENEDELLLLLKPLKRKEPEKNDDPDEI